MNERYYLREEYIPKKEYLLKEGEHHHLKVMRTHKGDEVELVNGEGSLARARVEEIEKDKTYLKIIECTKKQPPLVQVFLGLPLMRPSKLEWVIEKGTEIGAASFFLYLADQSTQDSLSDHQIERLRNITVSAIKQSGRLFLPHLEILPSLQTLLKKEMAIYFGDVRESAPSYSKAGTENILFITGPESGFSKGEVELLSQHGKGVRLNPNVLRAETAPLVALSILCNI